MYEIGRLEQKTYLIIERIFPVSIFLEALDLVKQGLTLNAIKIIVQFERASRAYHS